MTLLPHSLQIVAQNYEDPSFSRRQIHMTIYPALRALPLFYWQGISMKREFRVCDEEDNLHVREDICKGGDTMSHVEAHIPKKFPTGSPSPK